MMAAALSGGSMADVVRWIDEQEMDQVAAVLEADGARDALQAVRASWGRDERQRSAVYTTAETVVEAFADPDVAASSDGANYGMTSGPFRNSIINPERLLDGGNTLYLCAPAQDQRRLRPIFATLVSGVIEAAYE